MIRTLFVAVWILFLGLQQQANSGAPCPSCETAIPPGNHPITFSHAVAGAWFYKSESRPSNQWIGIRAEGKLPRVTLDPTRYYSLEQAAAADEPPYKAGPLDRPSVYLGGKIGGSEVDAGLSWDRVYDDRGQPEVPERYAFRPYWRMPPQAGARTQWNSPPLKGGQNIYFEPEQDVRMSIEVVSAPKVSPMRVALSICDTGQPVPRCFKTEFDHPGNPSGASTFKRVNSIDQFQVVNGKRLGCEGKHVVATESRALDASWSSVTLLRRKAGSALPQEVAMTPSLQRTIAGREFSDGHLGSSARSFLRDSPIDSRGGQARISILPDSKMPRKNK